MVIKQALLAYGRNEVTEDDDLEHVFHCVEMVRQVSYTYRSYSENRNILM